MLDEKPERRKPLLGLSVYESIMIIKCMFKKENLKVWTGKNCPGICSSVEFLLTRL
jgi:hypothetical protein